MEYMRKPHERQKIVDILKDELEDATRKIEERLSSFDIHPASSTADKLEGVRRFYEDLVDKIWTQADEEFLASLHDLSESEIKRMMREAFRRTRIYPVPNFAALITSLKKGDVESSGLLASSSNVSNADRERLANLLDFEMTEAAQTIASRLSLGEAGAKLIIEELEVAQGQVISRFTPLV
jgi:hypothetical protein